MRIAIDARPLVHPHTGIGRYTAEIASRLRSICAHDICLYAHRPLSSRWQDGGYQIRVGKTRRSPWGFLEAQFGFAAWLRHDDVDVFWAPRHHLPLPTSTPCVLTIHDLVWRKAADTMLDRGRLLDRLLMPPSIRKAEAIIAVSNSTLADLLELNPNARSKTTVIYEAPFIHGKPVPSKRERNFILFVGTHEPRKNIDGLLRSFRKLLDSGINDRKLILAGNPGWKIDVPQLIDELGIGLHVDLAQSRDDRELAELYANCDFLVSPSFYEGFGLPIVEALSFGKPVIASNVSAMPEVVGNAGILVNPHSTDQLTAAMKSLITDRQLHRTLSERARNQASKFSWGKAAEETLEIIEKAGA